MLTMDPHAEQSRLPAPRRARAVAGCQVLLAPTNVGWAVEVQGPVVRTTAEWERSVGAALRDGDVVELDLRGVTVVDEVGIGVLLGLLRRTREGGGQVAIDIGPGGSELLAHGVDRVAHVRRRRS